jgi:endonuclease-3
VLRGSTVAKPRDAAAKLHKVAVKFPRESAKTKRERAIAINQRLIETYPDAHCELDYESPFQLLVATILSAQSTDKTVNQTTPALFARYPTPHHLAAAAVEDVEQMVKSTGFYHNKTKSIQGAARMLELEYDSKVPDTMPELLTLPGVARKTANVVLGTAFGKNDGVVVDTHVQRLSKRLGLTRETDPVKIEQDLMAAVPREEWTMFAHRLIWHGRRCCYAQKPACDRCALAEGLCPSAFKV